MSSEQNRVSFLSRLRSLFQPLKKDGDKKDESPANMERIRLKYEYFREILAHNDSILQLIADIEDRLSGKIPFSFSLMVRQIRTGLNTVFMMVKNLDQLTSGHNNRLYDSLGMVSSQIKSELPVSEGTTTGPMVISLSELKAGDSMLVGTKMAKLGEIKNVLALNVPEGFAVTTAAFGRFMNENNIRERAEALEELTEVSGHRAAAKACREVQKLILDATMPDELARAIYDEYDKLVAGRSSLIAIRSSGVDEDKAASHAGLFYTELNVDRSWLLDAYRWVLASCYGSGPVLYRFRHGLSIVPTKMAAGILQMINPRYCGIMFSRTLQNPAEDKIVISVVPGLPDAAIGGGLNAMEIVVSQDNMASIPVCGLTQNNLRELMGAARLLENHFGGPQDIEWAVDENGILFILQCRPIVTIKPASATELPRIRFDTEPILSGGLAACRGIGAGPVFQVKNDDDLESFPDGAVLVSHHSSPKFAQLMNRCAAIITDVGSPIGHMSILAREFGIPAIVGLPGATNVLENGRKITVDAASLEIYDGLLLSEHEASSSPIPLVNSPVVTKLRQIGRHITPLYLTDTASPEFKPSNCRTLHDITRFVHEKVFEEMFYLGDEAIHSGQDVHILKDKLPYQVLVLDIGGGLADVAGVSQNLSLSDVASIPMRAFLEGLIDPRINWEQPRALSTQGFLSVLGESMAGPPAQAKGVGGSSFAIMSDRYMNFSTKAGYHFSRIDAYCGMSLNKNYIHFRFEGGGASELRRQRRCQFLSMVLRQLNFNVQIQRDTLVARLEKYDRETIRVRLADLGRLTICSRQLDMLMDTDHSSEYFAKAFLSENLERF